jgi:receptor-type tyrosine-protein phosphatase Q
VTTSKASPPLFPSAPVAAPQQLAVSQNSTSLTLSWNPPPFEDSNGIIQYYVILVTELDTNTSLPPRNSFTTQLTITNLHPHYTYQFIVAAYTVGMGPFTTPVTVQLDQGGEHQE